MPLLIQYPEGTHSFVVRFSIAFKDITVFTALDVIVLSTIVEVVEGVSSATYLFRYTVLPSNVPIASSVFSLYSGSFNSAILSVKLLFNVSIAPVHVPSPIAEISVVPKSLLKNKLIIMI